MVKQYCFKSIILQYFESNKLYLKMYKQTLVRYQWYINIISKTLYCTGGLNVHPHNFYIMYTGAHKTTPWQKQHIRAFTRTVVLNKAGWVPKCLCVCPSPHEIWDKCLASQKQVFIGLILPLTNSIILEMIILGMMEAFPLYRKTQIII